MGAWLDGGSPILGGGEDCYSIYVGKVSRFPEKNTLGQMWEFFHFYVYLWIFPALLCILFFCWQMTRKSLGSTLLRCVYSDFCYVYQCQPLKLESQLHPRAGFNLRFLKKPSYLNFITDVFVTKPKKKAIPLPPCEFPHPRAWSPCSHYGAKKNVSRGPEVFGKGNFRGSFSPKT